MIRPFRIVLEVLGPPFVGTLFASLVAFVTNVHSGNLDPSFLIAVPASILVGAYYFMTFPSIVFAVVMEAAFFFGLRVRSWITVILSSICGLVAGTWFGEKCAEPSRATGMFNWHIFYYYAFIGLAAGGIIGVLIRAFPEKKTNCR